MNSEKRYEQVIYEEFLPMFVNIVKDNDKTTLMIESSSIDDLNLNEKEEQYFIDFIKEIGINIVGECEEKYEKNYSNYQLYRINKNNELPNLLKTRETEKLLKEYKETKDLKIREQLILGNMRLVTYFSWFYSQIFRVDIEELEQYGYEGLIYAIDNYGINSSASFYSYAKIYIKRFINKGIYNIIGVNFNVNYCPYFLYKKTQLEKLNGVSLEEEPKLIEEIVDWMIKDNIISVKYKETMLKRIRAIYDRESIEDLIENNSDTYTIDDVYDLTSIAKKDMNEILSGLSERDKQIIKLRFGLEDGVTHTFEEIAKIMNVTRQRAHCNYRKAIKDIKTSSMYKKIKPYYDEDVFSKEEKQTFVNIQHRRK